jgi:hypothetical protein
MKRQPHTDETTRVLPPAGLPVPGRRPPRDQA